MFRQILVILSVNFLRYRVANTRSEVSRIYNYIIYQFPWQFLMLGLFFQSSISTLEFPDLGINWFDKILHFVVFGILGLLTSRGFMQMKSDFFRNNYAVLGMLLCIIYGAIDEIHQSWVPGRHSSIWDWVADTFGIIVFVWIYTLRSKQGIMAKGRSQ